MTPGEMRFERDCAYKRAEDYFNFAIEWQAVTGRLLMTEERTYEAGLAKIEDARARSSWLSKREMEESARAKERTGGKRADANTVSEDDRDLAVKPILFGNGRCVSRQGTEGKDRSNAWIWNGDIFTKRF